MRRYGLAVLTAASVLALGGSSSTAQENLAPENLMSNRHVFAAQLRGANETPAVSSSGHGAFVARIDDGASTITFGLTYAALEGVPAVAHVHFGQRDVAGGVMFFLCGGGGKPACPAAPATVTGMITAADVIGPNGQGIAPAEFAEVTAAIRAGLAYANVHTDKQPAGEIRGQLR